MSSIESKPRRRVVCTINPPEPSFAAWADRGFHEAIIPVIPPGVPAKVHGGAAIGDGKTPGSRVGFNPDGTVRFAVQTWYGSAGWSRDTTTPEQIMAWEEFGMPSNIGLRTAQFPCLDIDIKHEDDRALVEALLKQVRAECAPPEVWMRYRDNSPSCAVLFSLADGAEPFGKGSRAFVTPSGHEAKIELLASGQQIVVAGIHASGATLRWRQIGARRDSMPDMYTVGLPGIDVEGANGLLDVLYELVLERGGRPHRSNAASGNCGRVPDTTPPWIVQPGDDPFYQRLLEEEFLEAAVQGRDGRWKSQMSCPWEGEHGERPETGTAYFVGGGFSCAHNSCVGRRWPDVVNVLRRLGWPVDAMEVELWNARQRAQLEQVGETRSRLAELCKQMEAAR